jgi:large subunit ribosomal protein L6
VKFGNFMSRIGKKPVKIPQGVTVNVGADNLVSVTGPKGNLSFRFRPEVGIVADGGSVVVERKQESAKAKSLHGLSRSLVENMVFGVDKGWNKGLELVGVGYRAEVRGNDLVLNVGFSHPVVFKAPEGISFSVSQNIINVSGIDKQIVGETAAKIRRIKPPEPYKGKGIKYVGEVIRRKAGKAAKAATPGAK